MKCLAHKGSKKIERSGSKRMLDYLNIWFPDSNDQRHAHLHSLPAAYKTLQLNELLAPVFIGLQTDLI